MSAERDPMDSVTVRDHFAAQAMHAELTTCGVPGPACDALVNAAEKAGREVEEQIAWNSFRMADAMLREREIPSSEDRHADDTAVDMLIEFLEGGTVLGGRIYFDERALHSALAVIREEAGHG